MRGVECALVAGGVGLVVDVEGGCQDGLIRGANLGGWLLLEPWITPSLFEEVNKHTKQ